MVEMAMTDKTIEIDGILFKLVPIYFENISGSTDVSLKKDWLEYEEWGYALKPIKKIKDTL